MIVINLFGGPGTGKSTTAADLFQLMKRMHINCENVHEFAKELTWECRDVALDCQPYIFGKQMRNIWRLRNKVDVAIVDSPLLLSLAYGDRQAWPSSFFQYAIDQFKEFDNRNFFLTRKKDYNPVGRNQTETEALVLDQRIFKILVENGVSFDTIDADETAAEKIFRHLCMTDREILNKSGISKQNPENELTNSRQGV